VFPGTVIEVVNQLLFVQTLELLSGASPEGRKRGHESRTAGRTRLQLRPRQTHPWVPQTVGPLT